MLVAIFLLLPAACDDAAACEEGVVETSTGLEYEEIECGEGDAAARGDSVTVHYTGTLESNGEEFDSSRGGEPFIFEIGGGDVIAGWEEGVAGMRVGGTRKLTIPPELGYGKDGYPPVIPPDATLVFEIELLEIASN